MATFDSHKNFSITAVTVAPAPAVSGTTLTVSNGAIFPASTPYNCTVWPTGTQPTAVNAEIVRVTVRSTNTLTIVRVQESSTARAIVIGDQIALTVTAKALTDIEATLSQLSADGNTFTGAVNGTTGTFSGALSGTTGTFSGTVSAPTFSGNHTTGSVSATTGTFSGAISATTGTFSGTVTAPTFSGNHTTGSVTATTGTFSGAVSAASYGAVTATTGSFSGTVTAPTFSGNHSGGSFNGTTGTFSGAISATTGTFSGAVSATSYGAVNATTGAFSSTITSAVQGSRLGSALGSISSPSRTNTNLLMYDGGATNWSGIGADTGGVFYIVTGTASPATRFYIDGAGGAVFQNGSLTLSTSTPSYLGDTIPMMRGYSEKWQSVAISAGVLSFDISAGNHVVVTLNSNINSISMTASLFGLLSNYTWPVVFHLIGDGTLRSITWTINGTPIRFSSSTAPTLTSANGFYSRVVVYYMAGLNAFGEQIGYNA